MAGKGKKQKRPSQIGTGKRTTARKVQAEEARPFAVPHVEARPEVEDDGVDADALTPRQRLFCEAYVGPAGLNATRAAELAGYRSDNRVALAATGYENLRKPQIQRQVARLLAAKQCSPDWAEDRVRTLAGADMASFVSIDPETGATKVDMAKAQAAAALGQIREYTEERIEVGGASMTIKAKVKLHDPLPALRTLLQLAGRLVERRDVTTGGEPFKTFGPEIADEV
jgi:phage terminase small subunit